MATRYRLIQVTCPICESDGCRNCNYTARVTAGMRDILIDRKARALEQGIDIRTGFKLYPGVTKITIR
jgi:hypothetical protein